ncbi:MAG: 2,3,4,5-tetrahydropyridine-2,6-dicarboxylate N-succinyltransferase [Rickettsiales bacterium]|nr:2,3,4,5-tetrahydropyridine-2,6-dicarboxylate N-succinyltransferase [Rickettsiales bacterium]
MTIEFQNIIEKAFEERAKINSQTTEIEGVGNVRKAVNYATNELDAGRLRICEKINGEWQVNQWLKKAILLYFRLNDNKISKQNNLSNDSKFLGDNLTHFDKVPLKFNNWQEKNFLDAGFRAVAGSIVRYSAFISKGVILMPSFVNVGAFVDEGTMIDTWATVGSCAQIGKNCHISGGVGIGGVLEPLQANPVIIEDDCFIGARSEIAEGVIIEKGSVLSMGVYIGASTKIIDRVTGEVFYGRVPAYSVVVPGSVKSTTGDCNLYAGIIVKKVDEKTRSKTSINELLRD